MKPVKARVKIGVVSLAGSSRDDLAEAIVACHNGLWMVCARNYQHAPWAWAMKIGREVKAGIFLPGNHSEQVGTALTLHANIPVWAMECGGMYVLSDKSAKDCELRMQNKIAEALGVEENATA